MSVRPLKRRPKNFSKRFSIRESESIIKAFAQPKRCIQIAQIAPKWTHTLISTLIFMMAYYITIKASKIRGHRCRTGAICSKAINNRARHNVLDRISAGGIFTGGIFTGKIFTEESPRCKDGRRAKQTTSRLTIMFELQIESSKRQKTHTKCTDKTNNESTSLYWPSYTCSNWSSSIIRAGHLAVSPQIEKISNSISFHLDFLARCEFLKIFSLSAFNNR